ncbi:LPS export ABC transporter periplasmic protein LptC [Caulobacter sp. S45]|uniref:LPS export ABC transporter periplasmic protein LptC n=1 Tax=Caulobacter sp. S45 TaxID=1641861 RepID=UPI001575098B|nr:LPS export ABC transporter periplasmic protein LptC [Caulobacter sp. S45]
MALDMGYSEDGFPPPGASPDLARRAAALERWRRRSRQVQFFRKALPAAIAAIMLLGLGWVGVRALLSALARADKELGSIHLINPAFYGRNEKGELYIMSASEAVRDAGDPDRITLVNPDLLQYPAGAPAPMTTKALHGVYHEAHKLLDLIGNVVATDGRGYTFESQVAHVDMRRNSALGNAHVHSYGPSGFILADAYQVYDKGQHAIFTGHVHTHLTNKPDVRGPVQPAARPVLPAGAIPVPYQIFGHGAATGAAPTLRPAISERPRP